MKTDKEKAVEAAAFLKARSDTLPQIGFLAGTGLGESAGSISPRTVFPCQEIPYFPVSTVQTHGGRLIIGELQEKKIVAMQGRFHLYEGYFAREVTFPLRVMQELGVKTLIVSNAAGGLNTDFSVGDIMLIEDHINLTGTNPLIGPNEEGWGERFPDMSMAYNRNLAALALKAAKKSGIPLKRGVYAGLKGPSLETPAEARYLQVIGADAVGFSTVLEVITGVHAGMQVLGLAVITNVHDPENPLPADVPQIIATAEKAAPKLDTLIQTVIADLAI